jgi:enoyl-[acyl-carrier protein] reductase III
MVRRYARKSRMPTENESELPQLRGWALILGASSGFGAAACRNFARAGMNVIGVHLDRRAAAENARQLVAEIRSIGREAWFYNVNAADPAKRALVLADVQRQFSERARGEQVTVLLHSLAFGALKPYVHQESEARIAVSQLEMTIDVMANSLVYWTQDLLDANLFGKNARIFAMTSTGSGMSWQGYGAVSAAKAALEAHIRQLSLELSPRGITANAVCAGVTDTPALRKIPGNAGMIDAALRKNPSGRLTEPHDVARALVALALPCTYWMTGNVICVDGGEAHSG